MNSEENADVESTKLSQKTESNIKKVFDGDDERSLSCFVIQKIKELNPTVEIKTCIDNNVIFSSISVEELVLPKWFYYSRINWITDKYVTQSENYISIRVFPIEYYDPAFL